MSEKIFYVYTYTRLDNNTIFYVGKGKNNRYCRMDNRNNHFTNIVNSVDYKVEKIFENLSEDEAFDLEIDTIQKLVFQEGYNININGFNDKDTNKHLTNCTWGGEGTSGLSIKQSEDAINKRRLKNIGKKRTAEQKERMSDAAKNRKRHIRSEESLKNQYDKSSATQGTRVRCIELDMEFNSKRKAIEYMKLTFNIDFNKKSFKKHLDGNLIHGNDWYGEVFIDNKLIQLHWELI